MLELMVVVVLIAIGAAVATFSVTRSLPDIRLKAAARDLKSDLNLARMRAIRENANVAVLFDVANNQYTIFVDDGAGGGVAANFIQEPGEAQLKTVNMPMGVSMIQASFAPGGVAQTRFNGRGLTIGLGGNVRLQNANPSFRGVAVTMLGRTSIQESSDGGVTWNDI